MTYKGLQSLKLSPQFSPEHYAARQFTWISHGKRDRKSTWINHGKSDRQSTWINHGRHDRESTWINHGKRYRHSGSFADDKEASAKRTFWREYRKDWELWEKKEYKHSGENIGKTRNLERRMDMNKQKEMQKLIKSTSWKLIRKMRQTGPVK